MEREREKQTERERGEGGKDVYICGKKRKINLIVLVNGYIYVSCTEDS